jgi:hypothetical protein
MKPFDTHPNDRMIVLTKMPGANCRHEYGLKLQQLTKMRISHIVVWSFSLLALLFSLSACSSKLQSLDKTYTTLNTLPKITEQTTTSTNDSEQITIIYPQKDVNWRVGDTVTITWKTENIPAYTNVTVYLWDTMMQTPYPIGQTINNGSFTWTVTNLVVGEHLRLSVNTANAFGMSASYVNITS